MLAAPVAPFRVDVHPERDVVRVAPAGELDLTTVCVVDGQVANLRAAGFGQLVLDLRAVSFMDTTACSSCSPWTPRPGRARP